MQSPQAVVLDPLLNPAAPLPQGKRVAVSGSGNVAVYTVEKLLELGAVPLTMSDSTGYVYYKDGMTEKDLDAVNTHKVLQRGRLSDFKGGEGPSRQLEPLKPIPLVAGLKLTCPKSTLFRLGSDP